MSKPYDVGYKKPPKPTQFKKGKSGNLKGRPKGAISLKSVLDEELSAPMVVKEQGKARKITRTEALVKRLISDALNGKPKAMTDVLRLISLHLPEESPNSESELPASETDKEILQKFLAKALKQEMKADDASDEK